MCSSDLRRRVVRDHFALNRIVEHALCPAHDIRGHGRCAAGHDGFQHGVNVLRPDVANGQLADIGFDIPLYPASDNVRMFPAAEDARRELFVR